jgi:hypothetical protein
MYLISFSVIWWFDEGCRFYTDKDRLFGKKISGFT